MYLHNLFLTILISYVFILQSRAESNKDLAATPPRGWNSFDSYGVYLHDRAARENLEAFEEKLKPYGYNYFVIDAGWFGEFELKEGTMIPAEKHAEDVNINKYGLLQPSNTYFPNGLKPIIERCHELNIKFGLHLMRGIPRKAYRLDTPIKGSEYSARDIADTTSICRWNHQNYGIDMDKPGSQQFYNSLVNQMADWGVDFLKYDDIVPYPREVEAVAKAIEQCGRPIVLSLSPGGHVEQKNIEFFKKGNMLRVTHDIWDEQKGIDQCFAAWKKWQGEEEPGFWIDMDMIPFGQLQLMSPPGKDKSKDVMSKGDIALAGKGVNRWSQFTRPQMETFMTMRALAASPLFMGGDLPTLDSLSYAIITDPYMLACNQNGIMGSLVSKKDNIEIWETPEKDSKNGWIGIFNRSDIERVFSVDKNMLKLEFQDYKFFDIWQKKRVDLPETFQIQPNGVVFLQYIY
jgi:hypothetical protein